MALQATSVSPYDRVKVAAARSKATTNSNRARYDPDLVKCHLCPKVGTLSVIQNHIATYHSERPLQTEHNKNDHLRSSSPPQQQQGGSDAADLAESAKPADQMVEICASPDSKTMAPAARKFKKCSPQDDRVQLSVQDAFDGYDPPVLPPQSRTLYLKTTTHQLTTPEQQYKYSAN